MLEFEYNNNPVKDSQNKRIYQGTIGRILPNSAGRTLMIMIQLEGNKEVYQFRMDRMHSTRLLSRKGTPFKDHTKWTSRLEDAWEVYTADRPNTTVRLRFSPEIATRAAESQWHTSRKIKEEDDGSLLMEFSIAYPREMLPWIRSWGGNVEVLEPSELREQLIRDTRQMAELYGGEKYAGVSLSEKPAG